MVSIHRAPIVVILIISIVCFMFRFKRGSMFILSECEALDCPDYLIRQHAPRL